MKKLFVRKEFKYSPDENMAMCAPTYPYTIAFVYHSNGDSYIVKGGKDKVVNYIKTNVQGAALINYTDWRDGKATETTFTYGLEDDVKVNITKEKQHGTRRYHFVVVYGDGGWGIPDVMVDKWIRRRPRKWLKDLDAFIKKT